MSRRSLRLGNGLLDHGQPLGSTSLHVEGNGWRNTRMLKSHRSLQHSASCSESLLAHTPRKSSNQSLHSDASDASLLSSLLNESSLHEASIQESTVIDNFWVLDKDLDPRESTIMEEQSSVVANSTLIGSDARCPKHRVQMPTRVSCKDCECGRRESGTSNVSFSSKYTSLQSPTLDASTIYCSDRRRRARTDVLQLWLDWLLIGARRAAASCHFALARAWQMCQVDKKHGGSASRRHCGGDMRSAQSELHPSGSLCNDCKEKQHAEQTHVAVASVWSARASALWCLLRNITVFTVWSLCWLTSALWTLTRTMLSSSSHAAGRSSDLGGVFKWISRRSDSPLLTRFPLALFLVLPILFSLCWFGLYGLPSARVLEWGTSIFDSPPLSAVDGLASTSGGQATRGAAGDSEETRTSTAHLARLERNLALLWERVEAGDERAEQRHGEMLRMHTELQRNGKSGKLWLSRLVERQLAQLRRRIDDNRQQREQVVFQLLVVGKSGKLWLSRLVERQLAQLRRRMDDNRQQREQELFWLQSQMSRLDLVEVNLQNLAAKAEEEMSRQEAIDTVAPAITWDGVSVSMDRQSHDALMAQVERLEAALKDIRRDVDAFLGCQQLDQETISSQVSAQVQKEVRVLLLGNDLQAYLASLERGILRNVSLRLEQRRREEVLRDADGMALTREDVDLMVKNALRLFSHDRTGLADYALESGGGSILSTRCSETYETKAALLSLFGIPLWYFSQSPRVVIQPNVHPGNCWAFQGSTGFLVIRLSMSILPTAFSLEHIPKALAPSGTLRSAPRDFRVYGLDDAGQERGTLLGSYTYQEDGEALQTYHVTEENERAFQIIEVQVLSNWGHQEYTCLYRFRVHGSPRDA
ncbi:SUN domain-containing protein 1-like [Hippocampus comes]|uniref:SUN domain-containing protein 1-like n=1 Tax=Hippocampus comes TaxID=109280 RepID=UPI00094E132E|nr:PREDICTED: SUN domain-containing protein 1-like [Hippocampus comes]